MKSLGDRMKSYEEVTDAKLITRVPIILRVDGKAFHTLTKRFEKPFDTGFMSAMDCVGLQMLQEIQGAELAYIQSDEISVLIVGYHKINSEVWMGGRLNKMVSVGASIATAWFNHYCSTIAQFDCRAFNIPEDDVVNYFLWRARDNHRNSVLSYGQVHFSHKELFQKKLPDVHEMLYSKGLNWATDLTNREKNGLIVYKDANRNVSSFDLMEPKYDRLAGFINRFVIFRED